LKSCNANEEEEEEYLNKVKHFIDFMTSA